MAKEPKEQNPKAEPGDFGKLARRMGAWTTNSLLTVMVLLMGLGFGRQVLIWWAEDEAVEADPHPMMAHDGLGAPGRPHLLEFGNLAWSIQRCEIGGDRKEAISALRAGCRHAIEEGAFPKEPPESAETEFLAHLATRKPCAEDPDGWRMFDLEEKGFPLVVGVREGTNLADAPPRVVTWGLAVPTAPGAWSLYTFQPGGTLDEGFAKVADFPVPPGCQKTLSLRVAGGGAMIGFDGPEPKQAWTTFYDDWAAKGNWKAARAWESTDTSWYNQYTAPPGGSIGWLDIRFHKDSNGRATGLLILTLRNETAGKGEDS